MAFIARSLVLDPEGGVQLLQTLGWLILWLCLNMLRSAKPCRGWHGHRCAPSVCKTERHPMLCIVTVTFYAAALVQFFESLTSAAVGASSERDARALSQAHA